MNNSRTHGGVGHSRDALFVDRATRFLAMLAEFKVDYTLIGSCAVQSYLEAFFRLPNDIDIVVSAEDHDQIRNYFENSCRPFKAEQGRSKALFDGLPIHIIPGVLSVISKPDYNTIGRIDLLPFVGTNHNRTFALNCTDKQISAQVAPIELCFFLELIRPLYTDSLVSLFLILSRIGLNMKVFRAIFLANQAFGIRIKCALEDLPCNFEKLTFFSINDHHTVTRSVESLLHEVTGLSMQKGEADFNLLRKIDDEANS